MSFIQSVYSAILDALFPQARAERELFALSREDAYSDLPVSPASPLANAQSVFAYKDERVEKLVWNIKYKKSKQAIAIGGYALYRKLIEMSGVSSIIVPIPITSKRRRERGYNQCELLAEEIKKLDTSNQFSAQKDLLIRTEHRDRQTLKSREKRLLDAVGIFSVNTDTAVPKLPIIVIDDVITTGSTMKEAIETLRKAGYENVRGLSLAH